MGPSETNAGKTYRNVSLNHILILSATVSARARNGEAVQARVEEMISKGYFGTIEWEVTSTDVEWQEEEEIEIDVVQKE